MPTPTYTLISETVLGSAQASVTFSSIPQTYKDLVLEIVLNEPSNFGSIGLTVNGDTGANYSDTRMEGNGSSAGSARRSNATNWYTGQVAGGTAVYIQFMSYSNTNIFKTAITRSNASSQNTMAHVHLWRSTSAISSFSFNQSGGNLVAGTAVRLWGVVG